MRRVQMFAGLLPSGALCKKVAVTDTLKNVIHIQNIAESGA